MNLMLKIITWNANGLCERAYELENYMITNQIDIALISETHFTKQKLCKNQGRPSLLDKPPQR